jgi:hypothetical protein
VFAVIFPAELPGKIALTSLASGCSRVAARVLPCSVPQAVGEQVDEPYRLGLSGGLVVEQAYGELAPGYQAPMHRTDTYDVAFVIRGRNCSSKTARRSCCTPATPSSCPPRRTGSASAPTASC